METGTPPRPASWSHAGNIAIALWLLSSPATLGHESGALVASDLACGVLLLAGSAVAWRHPGAAWGVTLIGVWLMAAPLIFWAPAAPAYNNGTLAGVLVIVFAAVLPRMADERRNTVPPGWSYNPSAWLQRMPIVVLALLGALVSRYMAAYQLGHIPTVWDPFFGDGTARVLTSDVSQAFPVSDAGLGAWSYFLDGLAGLIGGRRRWRTMPWIVLLFGLFVIPPGVTSIVLVMLQPIGVGEWCTLCLVASVIMLVMVPPAIDEVVAALQFLARTRREGGSVWRALCRGEGSEAEDERPATSRRSAWRESLHAIEIVLMPWNLALAALLGVGLLAVPALAGSGGPAANNEYIIGALAVTFAVIAAAEPVRTLRWLNLLFGLWLAAAPWLLAGATSGSRVADVLGGLLLAALSVPRARVDDRYGSWDRWIR